MTDSFRRYKIFIACSEELSEDRISFDLYIRQKNDILLVNGRYFEVIHCGNFLDAMSATRLQDEYNHSIRDCHIFVMLVGTKVGQFTDEEFETAYGNFRLNQRPFIYTYFKNVKMNSADADAPALQTVRNLQERLSRRGHYCTKYAHVDTLKSHFGSQLEKLLSGALDFSTPVDRNIDLDSRESTEVQANHSVSSALIGEASVPCKQLHRLLCGLASPRHQSAATTEFLRLFEKNSNQKFRTIGDYMALVQSAVYAVRTLNDIRTSVHELTTGSGRVHLAVDPDTVALVTLMVSVALDCVLVEKYPIDPAARLSGLLSVEFDQHSRTLAAVVAGLHLGIGVVFEIDPASGQLMVGNAIDDHQPVEFGFRDRIQQVKAEIAARGLLVGLVQDAARRLPIIREIATEGDFDDFILQGFIDSYRDRFGAGLMLLMEPEVTPSTGIDTDGFAEFHQKFDIPTVVRQTGVGLTSLVDGGWARVLKNVGGLITPILKALIDLPRLNHPDDKGSEFDGLPASPKSTHNE